MKFVVLVAGVGSRLRPLTDERPKCMVQVGGQTIIERLLTQAEQTGRFQEAILLTGYRSDAVEQLVNNWNSGSHDLLVKTVHNPRYEDTNNGYSLWCAREELTDGFVLSDGDLMLEPTILSRVSEASGGDQSVLAVDMQSRLDDEAMKFIRDQNGNVIRLSKEIPVSQGEGESIGLCRISASDARPILQHLNKLIVNGEVNEYYERAFQEYLSEGWKPTVVDIGDLPWVEIDDHNDLTRAEENFSWK